MQLLKVADGPSVGARQRRRTRMAHLAHRLGVALSLGFLLLSIGGRSVDAQDAAGSAAAQTNTVAGQAGNGDESQAERPRLLFLLQRPATVAPHRDDPYAQLSATLRNAIDAANRYDIVLYGPEQPSIKRALLEHTIPVSDLVEPIRPDAFRRIARAIGARYMLTVKATFDKQGIKTEMRYDEDLDGDNWRTGLAEQIGFDAVVGKRHFKTPELIALTVDAVCARLNVPSHLAANIKVAPPKILGNINTDETATDKTVRNTGKEPGKQAPDQPTQIARVTTLPPPVREAHPKPEPNRGAAGTPSTKQPDLNGANKTGIDSRTGGGVKVETGKQKPTRVAVKKDSPKPPVDPAQAVADGDNHAQTQVAAKKMPQRQQPLPGNNSGFLTSPPPPVTAPAPTRPDYITLAMGARKDGDTSTEITLLRKAVTAAPHEPNLRRQLIQAYQDRHMTDLALAEAERAIALMPADSTLKRLYGDALLAKGDNAGALKVYREVVAHDPANVAAQVALADALLADNQYTEAMTAYQAAAAADSNSPLPHRRLARVYVGRAASDPTQYQESLKELALSRQLTPNGDTEIYLRDYVALMRQMEQRLRDMTDELQNNYQAAVQGTHKLTEVNRAVGDLKERAAALADYLDHVPFAVGHEGTHAHYVEGAAMLVQAIGSFRRVLANGNGRVEEAQGLLRVARVDTLHELATANKLLLGTAEPRRAMSNTSAGGSRRPDSIQ